ncbi:LAGLIDADG family homing endonuclease [Candidatus Woesearchaeota archaeon]|nr:LAGLIDADG family homing endonuclease [Candidatus Woesearchaeota archaeon]
MLSSLKAIKKQSVNLSPQKARILGHLFFDGSVFVSDYHYTISYINSSEKLVRQFISDVGRIYGLYPSSFEIGNGSCISFFRVKYFSKMLYQDVKKYSSSYSTRDMKHIPFKILNGNKNIKLEFLRAFWEDEGSITVKNRFKISADLKSYTFIRQLGTLHKQLGIDYGISEYTQKDQQYYKLFLKVNRNNIKKFFDLGLFNLSIVSKGENAGLRKSYILNRIVNLRSYI